MASTTTTQTQTQILTTKPPKQRLVCFSYAAYAKTLIDHLKSLNIPILPGLSDHEFTFIESTFHFTFPPDLRSILQEGLPVGPHFPNWRSSSPQQLHILLSLPTNSLYKNISQNNFWSDSWGTKSQNNNVSLSLVKKLLKKAPFLVPICRNCYIPSSPSLAGNPVFYIDENEVRVLSYDVSGFFQQVDQFLRKPDNDYSNIIMIMNMPAWAATEARRIEFWTELTERGKRVVARDITRGWWSGMGLGLDGCLEEVFWRLIDGGWKEEDVREMMMMDGCDQKNFGTQLLEDRVDMGWHVSVMSLVMLRAGWSMKDVAYSLDLEDHHQMLLTLDS